jgi:predicted negative regulator of RcsB-dependent stress response
VADLEEKEQLDAIRDWWSENGNYVMGGVAAGVIMIFGWNQWQNSVAETEIAASTLYEEVMTAAGGGKLDPASASASVLFSDFNETAYAGQARLAMASLYMDNARDQDAADVLRGLIASNPDKELALVGRLRLAKILLYQGKPEEVIELLKTPVETAFTARFSELLGDAYVEMGSFEEAQAAYFIALRDNPLVRTVDTNLVQLKLNDLPMITELAATREAANQEPSAAGGEESGAGDAPANESPDDGPVADDVADNAVENEAPADSEVEAD